ncbi:50S ribosomal protein L23 [Candidatus Woesearchaeota archaeon]|nr:50S ribosomal protein L23 [Candidatus Woesearchaeota archaeon]
MESYEVIKYPIATEKCFKLMETENKVVFIVDRKAKKPEIKKAVEEMFNVKVQKINTLICVEGKKAFVKLHKDNNAIDVATKLGLM